MYRPPSCDVSCCLALALPPLRCALVMGGVAPAGIVASASALVCGCTPAGGVMDTGGVVVPGRAVVVVEAPATVVPVCCDGVAIAPVGLAGAASPVERPRARGVTVRMSRLSVR